MDRPFGPQELQGRLTFVGEKGRLLLPHWDYPKLIVDGKYEKINFTEPDEDNHYHQFVDACMGKDECCAPFSYGSRLTEAILLGVIANRFPGKKLHWDRNLAQFREKEANLLLDAPYRNF